MTQSTPSLPTSSLSVIPKSAAPLRRQVLQELRHSILSGRLNPGERLIERELIAMMGVSRTVIREALRQLESEGLVVIIPNKGPVVRTLTAVEARELYAIRAVLEGLAARLFTEQAQPHEVQQLEEALIRTAEAYDTNDPEKILEAKNGFYDVLFSGARSHTLSSMIAMLHGQIRRWRAIGLSHRMRSEHRREESMHHLQTMLKAVRGKNAGLAEETMRKEVQKAGAEVDRLLAKETKPYS